MPIDRCFKHRGRKKKVLIKPISDDGIQTSTDNVPKAEVSQPTPNKPADNKTQTITQEKPRSRSTSIQDLIKANEERTNTVSTASIKDITSEFTQEDLDKCWTKYIESLEDEKFLLKNTLINCKPLLKGNYVLEISVFNPSQKEEINNSIAHITNFFTNNLNNSHIKINVQVADRKEMEMIYTAKEKYEFLLKENPNLEKLVQAFNLTLE